jgi:hypothetical protein
VTARVVAHVEEPHALDGTTSPPGAHAGELLADPAVADHVLRSVQDGRRALKRATLAMVLSGVSATGAWTNFAVTLFRALHHH